LLLPVALAGSVENWDAAAADGVAVNAFATIEPLVWLLAPPIEPPVVPVLPVVPEPDVPLPEEPDPDVPELPAIVASVWLIEISWSSEFSETIWLTICVGSTGEVGSWFCSSVTSRFRNVLSRLDEDVPNAPLDELLLVELVAAFTVEATWPNTGAAIAGIIP